MVILRSLAFSFAFYSWTLLMGLLFAPALFMPDIYSMRIQKLWSHGILWISWHIGGMKYEVRGRENVPDGPVLFAPKHQSYWDSVIFQTIFPYPAYVLKKELLKVPIFGRFCLKTGMIPVDREGGGVALRQMMSVADMRIREGRSIIIFPEGTRIPVGERGVYQPGVGGLYRHLKLPVVPVAVNSGMFWPRQGFLKYPGKIVVEFLEAIPPNLDRRMMMVRLEESIETATTRLCDEARTAR